MQKKIILESSKLKKSRIIERSSEQLFKDIFATIRKPLLVLDSDLRVYLANHSFYTSFKVTPKETIGNLIYNIGNNQWDIPRLHLLLEEILPKHKRFHGFQVEVVFPTIGKRIYLLNGRQIHQPLLEPRLILLAMEDITERTLLERTSQAYEERFRNAFQTAKDSLLLVEKISGKIINSNQAAQTLLGYSNQALSKRKLWEIGMFKGVKQFKDTSALLEETHLIDFPDTIVRTKSGQRISADVSLMNRAKMFQCNIRDITESKKSVEALQESKELFGTFFESSVAGISMVDLDGKFIRVNKKLCAILGYSPKELMQLKSNDITFIEDKEIGVSLIKQMAAGEISEASFEKRYVKKNGKLIWVHLSISAINDKEGKYRNFVTYIQDITERKKAEINLQEKVEGLRRMATVVSDSNDAVILHDFDGKILAWNRGAKETYGYSEAEALSKNVREIVAEPDREAALTLIKKIKQGEVVKSFELRRVTKDGRILDVWLTTTLLTDEKGKPVAIATTERDITERKKAEEKLITSLKDLERSNKDLEQFAYVASHDLQEPLRMVASYTQLLEKRYKDKLDSDALEFINYAVDGANRMQGLINDLLSFSRVGTRGKPSQLIDSHTALGQARVNLSMTIEENNAIVTNDDLPEVMADETQLIQLFQNLIGNAIKFHKPGESPRIHISAQRKNEDWVFSVRDNGIGIDPQYFDRIFVIFQRLNTREEYKGTGIGLAICKKIVERLGGKIWIESQPGQGATFYFTLK
jgi:PAS domain S-box-containing protein